MWKDIAASTYTRKGDPLKIDCGYRVKDAIKLFHAVALGSDVNSAKSLAFSYPGLVAGISRAEKAETTLTAVVEDHLAENDEIIAFALATMQGVGITVAEVEDLPSLARQARLELEL